LNELALFAGAGGGILGGHLLGWRTVCAVEWEPYPASVLCARQNDKILPPFPIWDDVQTFDGRPWQGIVDVVSGGFPCQDISAAGKGAGLDGERSGMWQHMARIIGEVRPRYAFIENSPMLTIRGLDRVLCDLAAMGFDAEWGVISAADTGAPHKRDRIWIVADSDNGAGWAKSQQPASFERQSRNKFKRGGQSLAVTQSEGLERWKKCGNQKQRQPGLGQSSWSVPTEWGAEPNVGRVAHGVAARSYRLKAIGNGQVPRVAATAFRILSRK